MRRHEFDYQKFNEHKTWKIFDAEKSQRQLTSEIIEWLWYATIQSRNSLNEPLSVCLSVCFSLPMSDHDAFHFQMLIEMNSSLCLTLSHNFPDTNEID